MLRLCCISLLLFGINHNIHSHIIYVPTDYPIIQEALLNSTDNDTILVADGIYKERINFGGKAVLLASWYILDFNKTHIDQTIIDGDFLGTAISFTNNEDSLSQIVGFTIRNGYSENYGGGVLCGFQTSPKIKNCNFIGNEANKGGGILIQGSPIIDECIFDSNSSVFYGGGIYCEFAGNFVINNCQFINNESRSGGAVKLEGSNLGKITNCLFKKNRAQNSGGIAFSQSGLAIINCQFIENTATNNAVIGCIEFCDLKIHNSLIISNIADSGAVISCSSNSSINFVNCSISDNFASNEYGIIQCMSSDLIFLNCIFYGNSISNNPSIYLKKTNDYSPVSTGTVSYSDIEEGQTSFYISEQCSLNWGKGNFDLNPEFSDSLYNISSSSPCIDAGDPDTDYTNEPYHNGKRINLGAYGNTSEAAISSPKSDIDLSPIDFGSTQFGKNSIKEILIQNSGKTRLNVNIDSLERGFSILSDKSISILGGKSDIIKILFSPSLQYQDSINLIIYTNEDALNQLDIPLRGFGVLAGEVSGILKFDYSPFYINENITVPVNLELIIEPGVTLYADSATVIKINGSLKAKGSDNDSITFTSSMLYPKSGSWKGLHLENIQPSGESIIEYCRFNYAETACFMSSYPVNVYHCSFSKCRWGIIQDLGGMGKFKFNQFEDLFGGIQISMSYGTIENNSFKNVKKGVFVMGGADINANIFEDSQCGIEVFQGFNTSIKNNKLTGLNYDTKGIIKRTRVRYLENLPIEALNAQYGIPVTGGDLADVYLLNLDELGDPNRVCVLGTTIPFEEILTPPAEGYVNKISLITYNKFILRTRDGGYAKVKVIGRGSVGQFYGYRIFEHIYIPADEDSFPKYTGRNFSDGVVVYEGNIRLVNNEISHFTGRGITFENAEVDTFLNNKIHDNKDIGIVFNGPSFFRSEEVIFRAGENPSQYNEIYNNGELDFINGTQTPLDIAYCYWGETDSMEISDKIVDGNDHQGLGIVNFSPFLDELYNPTTKIEELESASVNDFVLNGMYPNPFRGEMNISFKIGKIYPIKIRIFNLLGQEIRIFNKKYYQPGSYQIIWDGKDSIGRKVATGIYILDFMIGNHRKVESIIYLN